MRGLVLLLAFVGSAAAAETAGPSMPPVARISPAQAAMARYKSDYTPPAAPQPCQRPKEGEVVVCGQEGRGGSPDRLPLPDERGARESARTAIGEPPHMGVGDSPVRNPKGVGLTLTVKSGKTTLTGNGAE